MKRDIIDRADVESLVNTFYKSVKADDMLKPIFNDIAKVDWEKHLPKMYAFWSSILLEERSYEGNPMLVHIKLSKIAVMEQEQFETWMSLFTSTVDSLFQGPNASIAKMRAENIARLMLHKIQKDNAPHKSLSII